MTPQTGLINPDESFKLIFTVTVDPDAGGVSAPVTVQATAEGTNNWTPTAVVTTDLSDAGTDPTSTNPGAIGDMGTADDETPVLIADAGLATEVVSVDRDGGSLVLTINFVLENTGTVDLDNLLLLDDLKSQFGSKFELVVSGPTLISSTASTDPVVNPAWSTDTTLNMLDGTSGQLAPGESITIQVQVRTLAGSDGSVELIHQGHGGGLGLAADGTSVIVIDDSVSGSDPHGTNPGAPGDTGTTHDPTVTELPFYTYDSFNEFSRGFRNDTKNINGATEQVLLTKLIPTLAPEPIFSGSARPGTRIIGRIYDSSGNIIAEEMSFADTGGNWMMQMHSVASLDHNRIEFVEIVGQGEVFGAFGDIYGYLGMDAHSNDYAALEPLTAFAERYSLGSVFRGSVRQSLKSLHQTNNDPLGFGV